MPSVHTRPPWSTMTRAKKIAGIATTMRGARSEPAPRCRRAAIALTPPEAAPAGRVVVEALLERFAREIRPELVAEDELGIGELPQQVVRDAELAARSDQKVGIVHVGCVEVAPEVLLGVTREGSRCVDDLRSAAVVECHEQRDALVAVRELLRPVHAARELRVQAVAAADEAHPHALLVQLGRLAVDARREHRHQALDLGGRPGPVLGRERVDRELLYAQLHGVAQPGLDHVRPGLVAGEHRQAAALRPATVPVSDDGDVARPRRGVAHTSRISCSLPASAVSMSPTWESVSFWSSDSARCSSSEPTSPSLFSSRRSCITSRRTFRTATLPCSAMLWTIFTSSLRRSSVSSGIESRITWPSFDGVRPTSDSRIAFSIALIEFLSYGVIVRRRASLAEICESCLSGVTAP